jgi:hypothetical protein
VLIGNYVAAVDAEETVYKQEAKLPTTRWFSEDVLILCWSLPIVVRIFSTCSLSVVSSVNRVPTVEVKLLTLMIRVPEAGVSSLGPETGYLDRSFKWFSQSLQTNSVIVL